MTHELIQNSFPAFLIISFLFVFMVTNTLLDRELNRMFYLALLCVLILVIVDDIERYTASLNEYTSLRTWMSAIGYSLRPITLYWMIMLFLRNRRKQRLLYLIPAILNAIVAFSALFCNIAYSYSFDNQFVRGPLGYTAHIMSAFYLVMLMLVTIRNHKAVNPHEIIAILMISVANVVATLMETLGHYDGLLNLVIATSLNIYYLFLNTQNFKIDPLTNARNRRSLYLDESRNENSLSAVISLDINKLKQINDEKGHAAGDYAICTVAACVQHKLLSDCFLYRTGGDEFMVLCFRKKEEEVKQMMESIRVEVNKTEYTCAMGMVYVNQRSGFDSLCAMADAAMYADKKTHIR